MSSLSPREHTIERVEGKHVQEGVGGRVPSKLRKSSSSSPPEPNKRVPYIAQSKPQKMFEMVEGKPVGDSVIHYTVGDTQRWQFPNDPNKILVYDPLNATPFYGCITCSCGPSCGDRKYKQRRSVDDKPFHFITGNWLIPSLLWPFVEEMTAKSDDKTLVVTHITREITEETDFLKLFQPFGEVSSATLAPVDLDGTVRGGFGFVTFVNKEDAEKAMNTLNGSGPHGWDKCTLAVDWASNVKKT